MKKIWVHKSTSFKEAEEFDLNYYFMMTPEERLDTMQYLREQHWRLKEGKPYRKRLEKIIKIIK